MKQSIFITLNTVIAFAVGYIIWGPILSKQPLGTIAHSVHQGGPLVIVLIAVFLMLLAFVGERILSLRVAKGTASVQVFFKNLITMLRKDDFAGALAACDKQRGTTANVLRAGIDRFMSVKDEDMNVEKKLELTQSAIEEANALEGPLLERNLIAMSTIASIATMVGLLGTTIGMIRAFAATGHAAGGVIDATALATGISEALVNTAGGLVSGIGGIFFYNFFVNKVDSYNYTTDEATFEIMQLFKSRGA
ncbi:MAG: MotA/TolQ/ExbB proton channel family protein [candidate division Zixibacteria bacterium]|nr:MotA/TolQ/ExbB proton channel family protein [candidate division Zixibacteria bacterium]